jgi:hypothetical protein
MLIWYCHKRFLTLENTNRNCKNWLFMRNKVITKQCSNFLITNKQLIKRINCCSHSFEISSLRSDIWVFPQSLRSWESTLVKDVCLFSQLRVDSLKKIKIACLNNCKKNMRSCCASVSRKSGKISLWELLLFRSDWRVYLSCCLCGSSMLKLYICQIGRCPGSKTLWVLMQDLRKPRCTINWSITISSNV